MQRHVQRLDTELYPHVFHACYFQMEVAVGRPLRRLISTCWDERESSADLAFDEHIHELVIGNCLDFNMT